MPGEEGTTYNMHLLRISQTKLAALLLLTIPAAPGIAQTWTPTSAPSNFWVSVCSSADGTRLAAAAGSGGFRAWGEGVIYVSTNSGVSWALTSAPTQDWACVACSADGIKLAAAVHSEYGGLGSGQVY